MVKPFLKIFTLILFSFILIFLSSLKEYYKIFLLKSISLISSYIIFITNLEKSLENFTQVFTKSFIKGIKIA